MARTKRLADKKFHISVLWVPSFIGLGVSFGGGCYSFSFLGVVLNIYTENRKLKGAFDFEVGYASCLKEGYLILGDGERAWYSIKDWTIKRKVYRYGV